MSAATAVEQLAPGTQTHAILVGAVVLAAVNIGLTAIARTTNQVSRCIDVSQLLYLALSVFTTVRAYPFLGDVWVAKMMWGFCLVSAVLQARFHLQRRNDRQYRVAGALKIDFIFLMQLPTMLQWHGNAAHRLKYGDSVCTLAFYGINGWNVFTSTLINGATTQRQKAVAQAAEKAGGGEAPSPSLPPKRMSFIPAIHVIIIAGTQLL